MERDVMAKLTDKQANILRLIRRSNPNKKDGWYEISDVVWPIVLGAQLPPALVETRSLSDGQHSLRLTNAGEVVLEYLI